MAAVLTQQEIDALLAGISAGTIEVDQLLKEQPKQILPYDFRRPNRISKTQLRSLQSIHCRDSGVLPAVAAASAGVHLGCLR